MWWAARVWAFGMCCPDIPLLVTAPGFRERVYSVPVLSSGFGGRAWDLWSTQHNSDLWKHAADKSVSTQTATDLSGNGLSGKFRIPGGVQEDRCLLRPSWERGACQVELDDLF